ncbi:MAG: alkylhydroperoxidase, partial [Acidimicrobiia bacterium]
MLSHGAACRLRTRDPALVDQLLTNYRRADLPAPERSMLDFAVKVANQAHEMTSADIETMREAGW